MDRRPSSTSDSSRTAAETPFSLTTELLQWLDPEALPPRVKATMPEIGPFLWRGYNHAEIAQRLNRSEDWVSARVAEARRAIAEQVLEVAGDELPAELRARLEAFVAR